LRGAGGKCAVCRKKYPVKSLNGRRGHAGWAYSLGSGNNLRMSVPPLTERTGPAQCGYRPVLGPASPTQALYRCPHPAGPRALCLFHDPKDSSEWLSSHKSAEFEQIFLTLFRELEADHEAESFDFVGFVFPATILIMHPDYFSVMMISPLSPDRTRFTHAMLIPAAARTPDREEHWAKSFALIDEGVFFAEDLATVESMQRGLESGANETLLFGALEHAALWFHESLARRIAAG